MRAIFCVPIVNGSPQLPPIESGDGGLQLAEYVDGRIRDGCGWSCLGQVPQAETCLVLMDASETAIDLMAADPNYLFVEIVNEQGYQAKQADQDKNQILAQIPRP